MKLQIFKTKCNIVEKIFIFLLGISLLLLTVRFLYFSELNTINIFSYILLVLLFFALVFLAYWDFKTMEVNSDISITIMGILLMINLSVFIIKGYTAELSIFNNWIYSPYQNILSTLILGSIFQLIVLISKEKALGQGDVRIAIITGLLIGYHNLIIWTYITVFSALIYGLIIGFKQKKFKGLKIPFVPFMVLSAITILMLEIL